MPRITYSSRREYRGDGTDAMRSTGIYIVILFYLADAIISLNMLANGTHFVAVNLIGVTADFFS